MVLLPAAFDLGALAAALLCLLASIALVYIVKAISAALPNLSILGVGLNLARMFRDAGDTVMSWAVDNTKHLWVVVERWVLAHIYALEQLGGAVVEAIVHHAEQIAHVATSTIPDAIRTAEQDAARFTAQEIHGLETSVGNAYHSVTSTLKAADRALYKAAAREVASVEHHLTAIAAETVDHAEHFASHEVAVLHGVVNKLVADAIAKAEADIHTVKVDLTRTIGNLADTVNADFNQAKAIAQADATAALNTAKGLIDQAKTEAENVAQADATKVQQLLQAALDVTNTTVTSLTTTVGADLATAEQYAQAQVAAGLQDVSQVLSGATATVGGAIGAAATGVAADVGGIAGGLQGDISTALGQAEAAVGNALGNIYQDLTGQSLAYNGDLSTIAGALGLAITGTIAGVASRVAKLEKCSVGVCSDSPNNFSNLLQQALGIASFIGVGGALEQMIVNPVPTDREYAGVVGDVYQTGEGLFQQLLNL